MFEKYKHKLKSDANLKELLAGSAVTFVIKIIGMLLGYLVMLIISRKYGADGAGVYTLTANALSSIAGFGALGLNVAVLRYVGQFNTNEDGKGKMKLLYKYMMQITLPFTMLLGLLLYFFAREVAENWLHNPTYIPALKVGAIALPFFTLNLIQVEFIRGLKKLKVSEYLRSINRPMVMLILLLLSVFSYGVLDAVYAFVAGIIMSFLLSTIFIFNFLKGVEKSTESSVFQRKELLATSLPMLATAVSSIIMGNAAAFLLERYSTTDNVGIYNICFSLAQMVTLVLVVVNTISAPKFSELYWGDKMKELQKLVHQSTKSIFLVSLVISMVLIFFSKFILGMFGKEFVIGSTALIILVFGQIINAATGSVGIFLNMTGNQKVLRNVMIINMLLITTGYFLFIPKYGIVGAAVVTCVGTTFVSIICVYYVYRKLNLKTFYIPFSK